MGNRGKEEFSVWCAEGELNALGVGMMGGRAVLIDTLGLWGANE